MADEIQLVGLEDFKARITEVAEALPYTCQKHLEKSGNKLKKMLKDASPDSGHDHNKKLKDCWHKEVHSIGAGLMSVDVWSKAPHFHLVDRGHLQTTESGKVLGFKQGTHFLDKTVKEYGGTEAPKELQKLYNEVTKKLK